METIAVFLLSRVSVTFVKNLSGTISKRIRCRNSSRAVAGVVAQSMTIFPLFSSKYENFLVWRKIYKIYKIYAKQLMTGTTNTDEDF